MKDRKIQTVLVANKYHFISGGAERYFLSIMEALRKRGIEPIPLSVNYSRSLPTPYQKYFIEPVVKDGEAKILNQNPTLREKISLAKQVIYNERTAESVKWIDRDHKPNLAYLLNFINHISPSVIDACHDLEIPVVMRMSDFNLVCASNMYYRDNRPCTDCKKGLHHAILNRCVHGSLVRSMVSAFATSYHRWAGIYKKVSAFVAPTQFMKRELIELGFPEKIVHQINTFAKPQEKTNPDRERPYILFVGRFARYKGADTAIEAFSRVKNKRGVVFKLMGDEGDDDAIRVRALVQKIGCSDVKLFPFEREKSKIIQAIQGSLFTVLPSENYENLPNSILESFSCARAVISTRLGSIPDIVKDEEYGLLYDYGNIQDFSDKLDWLLNHEAECSRMGENAHNAILRDYSEEQHLERLLSLFEKVSSEYSPRKKRMQFPRVTIPHSKTLI